MGEIVFPRGDDDKTLSSDLHALAKSEAHSDLEFILPGGSTMHLHKIVLTNRTSQQWEVCCFFRSINLSFKRSVCLE